MQGKSNKKNRKGKQGTGNQGSSASSTNENSKNSSIGFSIAQQSMDILEKVLKDKEGLPDEILKLASKEELFQLGMDPVCIVAAMGHLDGTRRFVEAGTNCNDKRSSDGSTPLMLATQNGHLKVVELLLKYGAEVKAVNNEGNNAFMIGIKTGDAKIVNAMWPYRGDMDVNHQNILGYTALHLAVDKCWDGCVHFLLANGSEIDKPNEDGTTPLMLATMRGELKIMDRLISAGADLLKEDKTGYTIFSWVTEPEKTDIFKYLLAKIEEQNLKEALVKNRLDRMKSPFCEDDINELLVDAVLPLLQKMTENDTFRNVLFKLKVLPSVITAVQKHLKDPDVMVLAIHIICSCMFRKDTELVDERFVKQFIKSRGFEFCLKALKLHNDSNKKNLDLLTSCVFPIIIASETYDGKIWIEKNMSKISNYGFLRNHFKNACIEGGRRMWSKFWDFFNEIQKEQREKKMAELLAEEDRERNKKMKRKEKRKQKRHRLHQVKGKDDEKSESSGNAETKDGSTSESITIVRVEPEEAKDNSSNSDRNTEFQNPGNNVRQASSEENFADLQNQNVTKNARSSKSRNYSKNKNDTKTVTLQYSSADDFSNAVSEENWVKVQTKKATPQLQKENGAQVLQTVSTNTQPGNTRHIQMNNVKQAKKRWADVAKASTTTVDDSTMKTKPSAGEPNEQSKDRVPSEHMYERNAYEDDFPTLDQSVSLDSERRRSVESPNSSFDTGTADDWFTRSLDSSPFALDSTYYSDTDVTETAVQHELGADMLSSSDAMPYQTMYGLDDVFPPKTEDVPGQKMGKEVDNPFADFWTNPYNTHPTNEHQYNRENAEVTHAVDGREENAVNKSNRLICESDREHPVENQNKVQRDERNYEQNRHSRSSLGFVQNSIATILTPNYHSDDKSMKTMLQMMEQNTITNQGLSKPQLERKCFEAVNDLNQRTYNDTPTAFCKSNSISANSTTGTEHKPGNTNISNELFLKALSKRMQEMANNTANFTNTSEPVRNTRILQTVETRNETENQSADIGTNSTFDQKSSFAYQVIGQEKVNDKRSHVIAQTDNQRPTTTSSSQQNNIAVINPFTASTQTSNNDQRKNNIVATGNISQIGESLLRNVANLSLEYDNEVWFPSVLRNEHEERRTDRNNVNVFPGFHDGTVDASNNLLHDENVFKDFKKIATHNLQQYYNEVRKKGPLFGSLYYHDIPYYASCMGISEHELERSFVSNLTSDISKLSQSETTNLLNNAEHNIAMNQSNAQNNLPVVTQTKERKEEETDVIPQIVKPTPNIQNGYPYLLAQEYATETGRVYHPFQNVVFPDNCSQNIANDTTSRSNVVFNETVRNPDDTQAFVRNQANVAGSKMSNTQFQPWIPKSIRWRQKLTEIRNLPVFAMQQIGDIIIPANKEQFVIPYSDGTAVLGFLKDGSEVLVHIIDTAVRTINSDILKNVTSPRTYQYFLVNYRSFGFENGQCYIAMDLPEYSLNEYLLILKSDCQSDPMVVNKLAWQFLKGLSSLHDGLGWPHGNMMPSNIFVDVEGKLQLSEYSFVQPYIAKGQFLGLNAIEYDRLCWTPTEIITETEPYSIKSDIQVAGMILHYILSGGHHPYGDINLEIQVSIQQNWPKTTYISEEVNGLISDMLVMPPIARPSMEHVLKHPYFWAHEKRLRFVLIAGSDVLRDMKSGTSTTGGTGGTMIDIINCVGRNSMFSEWTSLVDHVILKEMRTFRQYKNTLVELVLFVYNCCLHFDKLSQTARDIIDEPCKYFLTTFPALFMAVFTAIKNSSRAERVCYKPFF